MKIIARAADQWLTTICRPLILITLTICIVARWFGKAGPGLTPEEVRSMWDAYEVVLGAYMIGRSIEKVVPAVADALRRPAAPTPPAAH